MSNFTTAKWTLSEVSQTNVTTTYEGRHFELNIAKFERAGRCDRQTPGPANGSDGRNELSRHSVCAAVFDTSRSFHSTYLAVPASVIHVIQQADVNRPVQLNGETR